MKLESLEIVQKDACGDNLKASIDYEASICIEIEEPWAGDTQSGFGRSGAVRLTRDQAITLVDWLRKAVEVLPPPLPKEPAAWGSSHAADPDHIAEQQALNKICRDHMDDLPGLLPRSPHE